jgi:hypothetical protein
MMPQRSEKVDTGIKVLALLAIIGLCLITSGVIIKTEAQTDPGWDYRTEARWISNGHIIQAIGVLLVSISFIWTAFMEKGLHRNVRAALVIGSMILVSLFILITITRYGYVF